MVDISVVIPVWNGRTYLADCLEALLAQRYSGFEVIAVDNASQDGSADFIARHFPAVKLIRNPRNLGFAGGCNVGLRMAEGSVLILLNQDTVVLPGWLGTLESVVRNPKVGVAGCKILYGDRKTLQHAGGWIEWPLGLAHHYGSGERDEGQWDDASHVEYVTGAAMAFSRATLERVGPLDEGFGRGYFEDVDFCLRVRKSGQQVLYEPSAVVVHHETTSLPDAEQVSLAYQQGRLRFLLKHLSPERFLSEFVPAEEVHQRSAMAGGERYSLRVAYFRAALDCLRILREWWQADSGMTMAVLEALMGLYRRAWEMDAELARGAVGSPACEVEALLPPFRDFTFHSSIPLIGGVLTGFRKLWFQVAAGPALRYFRQRLNEQREVLLRCWLQQAAWMDARLEGMVQELVAETEVLVTELAAQRFMDERGGG
ncbi:MAG: glycosyltransferase family 2 protein [Anaerolineae bacterium]